MKYIKTLNELIKNEKNLKSLFKKELLNFNNSLTNKLKNKYINIDSNNPIYFKVEISNITEKDWILWDNWLKKIKPIF